MAAPQSQTIPDSAAAQTIVNSHRQPTKQAGKQASARLFQWGIEVLGIFYRLNCMAVIHAMPRGDGWRRISVSRYGQRMR